MAAGFTMTGLDELIMDMETAANLPEEVEDEMLHAKADVVVAAQKKKIRAYGIYETGKTFASVKKGKVKIRKGQRVIYITPAGSRSRGKEKISRTRNAEILFVNEFGRRGQKARPAVRDANEASAQEATAAVAAVLDRYLQSKNL